MNVTPLGILLGLLPFLAAAVFGLVLARSLGISGKKRLITAAVLTIAFAVLPQTIQIFTLNESLAFELGIFILVSAGASIGLALPVTLLMEVLLQKIASYLKDG